MRPTIPALILAAGASTRMGQPKALLPLGNSGDCFVSRVVRTLAEAGLKEIVVVTGRETDAIASALAASRLHARVVRNPRSDEGQLSSLQVGLGAIDRPDVAGALVTLVDVPLVRPETVTTLLARFEESAAPLVRPARDGRHGHPVIFRRELFDELRHADPAVGAKDVVRRHERTILDVEVDDDGAFVDVDTAEDYRRLLERMPRG